MIVTDAVAAYLDALRPEPDPVLADMEAQGDRDAVPIVPPVTGRFLAVLAAATGARRLVEVGTAIGVSTLYVARVLPPDGRIVSFDVDPERQEAARSYLDRAGVLDRVELRLQDAREGLASVQGPIDFAFIDGVKAQYGAYLDAVLPLLRPGGLVAADNVLMSGTVAEGRGGRQWTDEQVVAMRAFTERLASDPSLEASVVPIGDGLALAVRRA